MKDHKNYHIFKSFAKSKSDVETHQFHISIPSRWIDRGLMLCCKSICRVSDYQHSLRSSERSVSSITVCKVSPLPPGASFIIISSFSCLMQLPLCYFSFLPQIFCSNWTGSLGVLFCITIDNRSFLTNSNLVSPLCIALFLQTFYSSNVSEQNKTKCNFLFSFPKLNVSSI